MATTVRVKGLRELNRKLQDLTKEVRGRSLESAVSAGGKVIRDEARARAPRSPHPQLHREIEMETESDFKSASARIAPTRQAFYGMFVELGTRHQAAQPFLRPALDTKGLLAIAAVRDDLRTRLLQHALFGG